MGVTTDGTQRSLFSLFFGIAVLTAAGPTAYVFCAALVFLLWKILPTHIFFSIAIPYILDCIFSKAELSGKRESELVRAWSGWQAIPDWFGMECILDDECALSPDQTYIFTTHPHGVFSWANCYFYCTGLRNGTLLKRFPFLKVSFGAASVVLKVPFLRDMCLLLGYRDAGRAALKQALSEGRSIAINLDGEAGSITARPGYEAAIADNRLGFVQLALSTGSSLVPCYVFGLSDVYRTGYPWALPVQRVFHRRLRWATPIFYSRYLWLPDRKKVVLVIGRPIATSVPAVFGETPDPQRVLEVHALYVQELENLFEKYKERLGYADRRLNILDANNPY